MTDYKHQLEIRKAVTNANEKRLLGTNNVDVNQLRPMKYGWAYEHYLNGCANNWMPTEVSMAQDIAQWKSNALSDAERLLVKRIVGFFSTAEGLVANNIVLGVYKHIPVPEVRMYLLRQAFEEAIHQDAFMYIIASLGLDDAEMFGMYAENDSIRAKDEFELRLTEAIADETFRMETIEDKKTFLKNLIGYYIILEGIFFYSAFAAIAALRRQNKMIGFAEQIDYISRDETTHLNAGIDIINGIKEENPELWDKDMIDWTYAAISEAVELEQAFADDLLPEGLIGFNKNLVGEYVQFIADRRLERIGLNRLFNAKNPFPWMSESLDMNKEKNFFENRVTEYQKSSSLTWE